MAQGKLGSGARFKELQNKIDKQKGMSKEAADWSSS